jgi:photosystem II stability/assembly factor-like uncharacterized protein
VTPSTTAPAPRATILVGTDKGLFRIHPGRGSGPAALDGPHLAGYHVLHVVATPGRPQELLAAVDHPVWGAHLYRSGNCGESWESLPATPRHPDGRHASAFRSVWHLAWSPDARRLYAGVDPAGLFVSEDGGASWRDVRALNEHHTRSAWEPSRGLFALHSVCVDHADPGHLVAAVSAGGTYRSDDGGRSWTEITNDLPSDFGYAITCDPFDPDIVYQIPESSSHLRATVDGRLRVYRSIDAGASWQSVSEGLPQQHVYVTVLREAMDADATASGRVCFGTSSGHVFLSGGGGRWTQIAEFLPRVLCVRFVACAP